MSAASCRAAECECCVASILLTMESLSQGTISHPGDSAGLVNRPIYHIYPTQAAQTLPVPIRGFNFFSCISKKLKLLFQAQLRLESTCKQGVRDCLTVTSDDKAGTVADRIFEHFV